MPQYMLDTVTCIHTMKAEATSRIVQRFNRYAGQICVSSIVLAELRYGAENSAYVARNHDQIERLVAQLDSVFDFDQMAAEEYGRVRFELRKSPMGPLDMLIAAHARSRSFTLVTENQREFSRLKNLEIETWL